MTQYRLPRKSSKYYIPGEEFLTVVHFCRQYPLWVAELAASADPMSGINYSGDRVQTSNQSDPTSDLAMRRNAIQQKKDIVDAVAAETAGDLAKWLVLGVGHGLTYYQLREAGIPCGKEIYYALRRKFYFDLSKRI